jgi:ABC-type transporter Mla subunit MlaD
MIAPQANRWKLGLFVSLVVTLGVGALIVLGATQLNRQKLAVVTYFDETVQGLDAGSALKWRGVPIGSVSRIGIAPDRRHVEVHMDVYSDLLTKLGVDEEALFDDKPDEKLREKIQPDMRVRLVSAGITGLKFLELDRLPDEPLPVLNFPVPDNYVPSAPSVMVGLEMGVSKTVEMLPELLNSLDKLVASVDGFVTEFKTEDLAQTLSSILQLVENELKKLGTEGGGGGLASISAELQRTLVAVQGVATELQQQLAVADVGATASAVRDAAISMTALTNETGAPGASLGEGLYALRQTLERAQELLELIERQPDVLLAGRASETVPEK